MISTDHIIGRLIIKPSFSSLSLGLETPKKLYDLGREVVPPVVDRICAGYDLMHRKVVLERVMVDLGPIPIEELPDTFQEKLTRALLQEFEAQIGTLPAGTGNAATVPAGQNPSLEATDGPVSTNVSYYEVPPDAFGIIRFFLQTGALPASVRQSVRITTLVDELLDNHLKEFTQLVQPLVRKRKPRKRLAHHLSRFQLARLVSHCSGPEMARVVEVLLIIPRLLGSGGRHIADDTVVGEVVLAQLFATDTSPNPSIAVWNTLDTLAKRWEIPVDELLEVVKKAVTPSESDKLVRAMNPEGQKTNIVTPPAKDNSRAASSVPAQIEDEPSRYEDFLEGVDPVEAHASLPESILVQNAGILLTWPFLEGFFEKLALTVNGSFQDENARIKATHLLHYLATAHDKAEEYELVMYKLLCGIPADEPLPITIHLTDYEKEFSDGLIRALIKNWPAVGDTDITSIRETYFKRPGHAFEKDNGWLLEIEYQTWDILLDSLPWGIGSVHLPWMKQMIHVAWKTN